MFSLVLELEPPPIGVCLAGSSVEPLAGVLTSPSFSVVSFVGVSVGTETSELSRLSLPLELPTKLASPHAIRPESTLITNNDFHNISRSPINSRKGGLGPMDHRFREQ